MIKFEKRKISRAACVITNYHRIGILGADMCYMYVCLYDAATAVMEQIKLPIYII